MIASEKKKCRSVMIVAGEASGDLHGANLVHEMKALDPSLAFSGVGGARLEAEGVSLVARSAEMAVVGITEVFAKIRFIYRVFSQLRSKLRVEKPDLLVLIDYPDFNLRLAASAKAVGVPVFYYISPQVWAWRKSRIHQIRRIVDRMVVILPFEKAFYAGMGLHVDFVGHPLLDVVKRSRSREKALADFIQDKKPIVALLPGSREKEIKSLLPEMVGAAALFKQSFRDTQFILPLADTVDPQMVDQIIHACPISVKVISGQMYDAVGLADIALVASGTATLETALLEIPMVIIYRTSPVTAAIGRRLIRLKHIGLVNIIAGETIVPELIQESANAANITETALKILSDKKQNEKMRNDLANIKNVLGEPGAAARAAKLALDLLNRTY